MGKGGQHSEQLQGNSFEDKRDSTQAQSSGPREELDSTHKELAVVKQHCIELSEVEASAKEHRRRAGLKVSEAQGALEELSHRHVAMKKDRE